jgi:hypothetical protein
MNQAAFNTIQNPTSTSALNNQKTHTNRKNSRVSSNYKRNASVGAEGPHHTKESNHSALNTIQVQNGKD